MTNFIPHHYNNLTPNPYFSNVRCTEDDIDITTCPAERENEFENSCTHEHDVGLRCHELSWAGVRLGVLAERADLQFITVERAGLLDYSTNIFKPGETCLLLYYVYLWSFCACYKQSHSPRKAVHSECYRQFVLFCKYKHFLCQYVMVKHIFVYMLCVFTNGHYITVIKSA